MQHFLRGTVEASSWCRKCGKATMHLVFGVKPGSCKACLEKLEAENAARAAEPPAAAEQVNLF